MLEETHAESLALLVERRKDLSSIRTRSVNQLHALLRELLPGGVPTDLTAPKATTALRALRPVTATDRVRKSLAMDELLNMHGTTLRDIPGIGPVMPPASSVEPARTSFLDGGGLRQLHRHCDGRHRQR
ncbi:hypothetical protein [Nocardia goodfellowii]|uniref:Transposase n=1 Tax=Nocardia goodfellowii TaxID=882446 RepID=A0ABS4QEY6_9NOCA|nr:hypothetical protein [Nocardia goodfellowii]MBP2189653.1 transposase [Nocardia goodfellowii]